jgi:hypothetical protein
MVRMRRDTEWGVVHVHQDLLKKCQVMATRMLASPVKTLYAETLGTHGKYLDDLACGSKYIDTMQAVSHMIVACISASDPALVIVAEEVTPPVIVIPDGVRFGDDLFGLDIADDTPADNNNGPPPPLPPPSAPPPPQVPRGRPVVRAPNDAPAIAELPDAVTQPSNVDLVRTETTTMFGVHMFTPAEVNAEGVVVVNDTYADTPLLPTAGPPCTLAPPPGLTEETDYTPFLPNGTGIMGYMCPDADLSSAAADVKVGELREKSPAADASKIESREALIERLHIIASEYGVLEACRVMKQEGIIPQARVCGAVTEEDLPKIAGSHSTCEKAGIGKRHFVADPIAGKLKPEMLSAVREAVTDFIKFVKTGMTIPPDAFEMHGKKQAKTSPANAADMTFLDWDEMMSKSWVKEEGWKVLEKVFTECLWNAGTKKNRAKEEVKALRSLKRSFFVKLNEALAKVKPRLIQQCGKDGSATHISDAGVIERILFGLAFMEFRSIKHATPKQLRRRFSTFLDRFMSGYAMSGDFGKYDSCMKAKIRAEVENTVVWELLQG